MAAAPPSPALALTAWSACPAAPAKGAAAPAEGAAAPAELASIERIAPDELGAAFAPPEPIALGAGVDAVATDVADVPAAGAVLWVGVVFSGETGPAVCEPLPLLSGGGAASPPQAAMADMANMRPNEGNTDFLDVINFGIDQPFIVIKRCANADASYDASSTFHAPLSAAKPG